jgi:hypothetical protein
MATKLGYCCQSTLFCWPSAQLIEQLRGDDHEADLAESMLHALETSPRAFEPQADPGTARI